MINDSHYSYQVLYIPQYWWHHIENVDTSVSLNFWRAEMRDLAAISPCLPRDLGRSRHIYAV